MSRSVRNTTAGGMYTGMASARSEKEDKKLWHGAWRAAYRKELSGITPDSDVVAVSRRAVSNVWDFSKDGHSYWSNRAQKISALRGAERIVGNQSAHEIAKLAERKLHKFRAK